MLTRRVFCQLAAAAVAIPTSTQVRTKNGELGGVTVNGTRIFKGIPFAQPPIRDLRFLPPQPVLPWSGIRDALNFAPSPMQAGSNKETSEDCLYLNVYAPATSGPHPVFVWIYGGGNVGGSTNSPMFDGSTFAKDNVVCVTIAYRVGAFGFLELGNIIGPAYAGSANNGIRDQIMALRWVKENIAAFGGDPDRVTVGGQSAGAKDVAALFASPEARGLFRSAIMESGSGQTVFSLAEANDVARYFAGIAPDPRRLSSSDIVSAQQRLQQEYSIGFPFRPVIDGKTLPKSPLQLVSESASKGTPLLIGTNRDESVSFVNADRAAQPLTQKELANTQLQKVIPVDQSYAKAFPDLSIADRHIRLLTAEEYWVPSVRFADAHSQASGLTYMYRFDRSPTQGKLAGKSVHASELPSVWDRLLPADPLNHQMHKAWISFISNGTPEADGLPRWPAYNAQKREVMLLDNTSRVESNPNGKELSLWQGIL